MNESKLSSKKHKLLSALKAKRKRSEQQVQKPPMTAIERKPDARYTLSRSQERLMFNYQRNPKAVGQNLYARFILTGPLQVDALEQAIGDLRQRHEILRAAYKIQDHQVHMVLPSLPAFKLQTYQVQDWDQARLEQTIVKVVDQAFKLEQGETFAAHLFQCGPERHQLLFVKHHIVSDGWSLGLITRELSVAYNARLDGKDPNLPPQALQYIDYAAWEKTWLDAKLIESKRAYWQKKLAGLPILELPTDLPRPAVFDSTAASLTIQIDDALVVELQELCKSQGISMFMLLLAAFHLTLSRYSGQGDFAIGTTWANRSQREVESMIGFFVNLLTLRTPVDETMSTYDYLKATKKTVLQAFAHQEISVGELIELLKTPRDPSRNPIFQAFFALLELNAATANVQNTAEDAEAGAFRGIVAEPVETDNNDINYDISLHMGAMDDGLRGVFIFAKTLFKPQTVEMMGQHLVFLLQTMVERGAAPIAELPLLEPHSQNLLRTLNQTYETYPAHQSYYHAVLAGNPDPNVLAVRDRDQDYRLAELLQHTHRYAALLKERGIRVGDVVGLCRHGDWDFLAAMLAILQVGAVYMPLDPTMNSERLRFQISDSGARLVFADADLEHLFQDSACQRLEHPSNHAYTLCDASRDLPAYIIYTSGSTGKPKGVLVSHANILNFLQWGNQRLRSLDCCLPIPLLSNPVFDASFTQLGAPLLRGDYVWMLGPKPAKDPHDLLNKLLESDGFGLNTVNSLWHNLLGVIESHPHTYKGLKLRLLLLGGEAVGPETLKRTRACFPDVVIGNNYGPTETTVNATFAHLKPDIGVPIGTPVANTSTYVVDQKLRLIPVGAVGELVIGGSSVSFGYLGRHGLTARQFVPDPFANRPGARLYRSGDLVRLRCDSQLEYVGRIDHQIKLRGFRIELGEIENALNQFDGIKDAVVVLQGSGNEAMLAAFVVASHPNLDLAALRLHLDAILPEYMVPNAYDVVSSFPTSNTGKIDRKALANHKLQISSLADYREPQTATERAVAQAFQTILGLERVGLDDHFFQLGGHSMMALQLVTTLGRQLELQIPVAMVFDQPVVQAFAEALTRLDSQHNLPPLERIDRDEHPLSFSQQRLWFLYQLDGPSPIYNIPMVQEWRGPLAMAYLQSALASVVERHQVLRTIYRQGQHQSLQVVLAQGPKLNLVDLSAVKDLPEQAMSRLVETEMQRCFKIDRELPLSVILLRLEAERHILLFNVHHIAFDGYSTPLLLNELRIGYAQGLGQAVDYPPLPIRYSDYAAWQKTVFSGAYLAACLDFWKAELADAEPVHQLPLDRPRPAMQTFAGGMAHFALSAQEAATLKAFSKEQGVTLFMTLLGSFGLLLMRYADSSDIIIGTPSANRDQPETQNLLGFFVNTLVLRLRRKTHQSFENYLKDVAKTTKAVFANAHMPFDDLVEKLNPERSMSYTPIFQIMFSLIHEQNEETPFLQGIEPQGFEAHVDIAKFDLSLGMIEGVGGLAGSFNYASALFDHQNMTRMADQFSYLLRQLANTYKQPIARLELESPEQRRHLMAAWETSATTLPEIAHLSHAVAQITRRDPQACALKTMTEALSYTELMGRVDGVALQLQGMGIQPMDVVALCRQPDLDFVVTMLAIFKLGLIYLPMDPSMNRQRLEFMLSDSAAKLLVRPENLALTFAGQVLTEISKEPASLPDCPYDPATPAYIIYTSGSTGQPKGVLVSHRNIFNFATWWNQNLDAIGARLPMPLLSNPIFDASFTQLLAPLLRGDWLWLVGSEPAKDPQALLETLNQDQAFALNTVNSLWSLLLAVMEADWPRYSNLPIKLLMLGGEAVSPELLARTLARFPQIQVGNNYGPTETTVNASFSLLQAGLPITIGQAVSNTACYVVDSQLQPVAAGGVGELVIAGLGVSMGYLRRPALTASQFVPDPFSALAGMRLYRSGDRVRQRHNGDLDFLGRIDQQIKLRGYRMELGEIENAFESHEAVQQVAVLVLGQADNQQLHAFVEANADQQVLLDWIGERLPDYMRPKQVHILAKMPLLESGKIDRKSLPHLVQDQTSVAGQPPQGPIETAIADIFKEVLGLQVLPDRQTDFFELGGHSLNAMRVIVALNQRFEQDLPLRLLFQHRHVAALASAIAQMEQPAVARQETRGLTEGVEHIPLSFNQMRLWLTNQLEPGNRTYNIPLVLEFHGALDKDLLDKAFQVSLARHAVLRTRFPVHENLPYQQIEAVPDRILRFQDLSHLKGDALDQALDKAVHHLINKGFDLEHGPVLRSHLVCASPSRHILVLCVHHIAFDGASTSILFGEVALAYARLVQGAAPELAPLPAQYADFSIWQTRRLQGEYLQARLDFWRDYLNGASLLLELPTDLPRPVMQSNRGATHQFTILPATAARLDQLAKEHQLTAYMVFLSLWSLLLGRYADSREVLLGSPVAGRDQADYQNLVGFFINTVTVRTSLSPGLSLAHLFAQSKQRVLDAFEHQDMPFERLVESLQPQRSTSHSPIFQVMLAFQNFDQADLASLPPMGDLQLKPYFKGGDGGAAKFDLSIGITPTEDGYHLNLQYCADLFLPKTIENMAARFLHLVERVVDLPQNTLCDDLSLLTPSERHYLVSDLNQGVEAYTDPRSLATLFEAVAAQNETRTALVFGDAQCSYADLDRKANRVGHLLQGRGLKPGQPVAVYMDRSIDVISALLGVLKTGAYYLPIDPKTPADRIAFLLEDSGTKLVLTQHCLRSNLPAEGYEIMDLDLDWGAETLPDHRPGGDMGSGGLLNLIYTSGTTGKPKGVIVPQSAILRLIRDSDLFGLDDQSTIIMQTSIAFDVSDLEIWEPLLNGSRIIVLKPGLPDVESLRQIVRQHQVSHLYLTVALFHLVAEDDLEAFRDIRVWLVAGDVMMPHAAARLLHQLKGVRLINGYGPTENGCLTTAYVMEDGKQLRDGMSISIGESVGQSSVYITDEKLRLQLQGSYGELVSGGDGVCHGYHGRPALTAEKFVPDPFSIRPGSRLYKTGDKVRWRADGTIEFAGRFDTQVKLRGFRIELGEIENCLQGQAQVQLAAVVVAGEAHQARLVAFLQAPEASLEQVQVALSRSLPAYMQPGQYVMLDKIPTNTSGKVDRKALKTMVPELKSGTYVSPENPQQAELCQLFETALGTSPVGIHDDFFALGGHSLAAVKLLSLIDKAMGHKLPLAAIFQNATPAKLVQVICEAGQNEVLMLKEGDPILWLLPPIGGQSHHYAAWAANQRMGVRALQDPRLTETVVSELSLKALVDHYLQAILEQQNTGPYHLGGWSMGGILAYEVCLRLEALGHEVQSLKLIDVLAQMHVSRDEKSRKVGLLQTFLGEQGAELDPNLGDLSDGDLQAKALEVGLAENQEQADHLLHLWKILQANGRAILDWRAALPIRATVTHTIASDTAKQHPQTQPQWREIATTFTGEEVDGNHFSILAKL